MELESFLNEALKERYKANSVVSSLEKRAKEEIERVIMEQYRGIPLLRDGMKFKLFGVRADLYYYLGSLGGADITLNLAYLCESKLPKKKREKLLEVEKYFEEYKQLPFNTYKVPIWHNLKYKVGFSDAISGNVRLGID